MRKYINWMLGLLLVLTVCGCEKDESGDGTLANDVFPFLKKGNTWVYNYSIEGEETTIFEQKISGIDEFDYFKIETTIMGITHSEYRWEATEDYFADIPDFPLFYKNGNVGKKWIAPESDEDLGTITREIIAIDETMSVPAGSFTKCQKVKQTFEKDDNVINYLWISPEAGIVKQEATGWEEADGEIKYFGILFELKTKNF